MNATQSHWRRCHVEMWLSRVRVGGWPQSERTPSRSWERHSACCLRGRSPAGGNCSRSCMVRIPDYCKSGCRPSRWLPSCAAETLASPCRGCWGWPGIHGGRGTPDPGRVSPSPNCACWKLETDSLILGYALSWSRSHCSVKETSQLVCGSRWPSTAMTYARPRILSCALGWTDRTPGEMDRVLVVARSRKKTTETERGP